MSNCQRRNCTNDVVPPARYCSVSCNRARWWHRKIRVEEAKKPAPPPEGCNPVQARQCQNERQVDKTRRILCRKYDTCLDHAVVQHWTGFSCTSCRGYEELNEREFRRTAPTEASLNLVKALMNRGRE